MTCLCDPFKPHTCQDFPELSLRQKILAAKESAIRADERERCRAELRGVLEEMSTLDPDAFWTAVQSWAEKEAFGGDE
jgi:hypothetical protein